MFDKYLDHRWSLKNKGTVDDLITKERRGLRLTLAQGHEMMSIVLKKQFL